MPEPLRDIYFSYWSWSMIKQCPHKFYLNVIVKTPRPEKRDMGNAIQGSIPHAQSEDFFKIPIQQRDMNFFLDTFEQYWNKILKESYVDWDIQGARYLKYMKVRDPFYLKWAAQYRIPVPPSGNIYKDAKIEQIIGNHQQHGLAEFGLLAKKAETFEHTKNLMRLIAQLKLHQRTCYTEIPFKVTVEPEKSDANGITPALTLGGRIDLVAEVDTGEEIWDVKGVKDAKQLDVDQLTIYRMGRRAQGKIVTRVGYLDLKGCKADARRIHDTDEHQLRKQMRFATTYFKTGDWPANYIEWQCKMCDVKEACATYKIRTSTEDLAPAMTPGKVPF
jgi:hypothetical protein